MSELSIYSQAEWISAARKSFVKKDRENCFICKKHKSITEAHHTYPLSKQFLDGLKEPDDSHIFLCPNHHAYIHRLQGKHNQHIAVVELGHEELRKLLGIMNGGKSWN